MMMMVIESKQKYGRARKSSKDAPIFSKIKRKIIPMIGIPFIMLIPLVSFVNIVRNLDTSKKNIGNCNLNSSLKKGKKKIYLMF